MNEREIIIFLAGALLGGILMGSACVTIFFDEAGKPRSAYERVLSAIRKIRGIYEES